MNIYLVALVIFVTFVTVPLAVAWWIGRHPPIPLERLADPAPLPYELPIAGYFDLPDVLMAVWPPSSPESASEAAAMKTPIGGTYGPFPVDTGPLLILSEQAAANVALEREIRLRCAEAEAKIPPRWRS